MVEDGFSMGQESWKWRNGRERSQGGQLKSGVMVGDDLGMELLEMPKGPAGVEEREDLSV